MSVDAKDIISCFEDAGIMIDLDKIDHEKDFDSQGIDSLDLINVYFQIEERFDIKIPEEDLPNLVTIAAIVSYMNSRTTAS